MATITKFEDLEIWKMARKLSYQIFIITETESCRADYRLKSQIRAAAGSVMDNIAEGFEREGKNEFKQFLYIGKGSAGEVRSQLYRMFDNQMISETEFNELRKEYEKLSVKIKNFIQYLQNTEHKGIKYKK